MIYNSITTLPLNIYDKISKTGNLEFLGIGSEKERAEAWENINREFFEEFGLVDKEIEQIRSRIRVAKHMLNYYFNNDKFAKTLADIEIAKQSMYQLKTETNSLIKACVLISKSLEMRIDYNNVTVGEFFHYVNLAEELSKTKNKK